MLLSVQGICRKPKHCREHHRALVDHVSGEGCESPNAFTSVHPSCAAGPMKVGCVGMPLLAEVVLMKVGKFELTLKYTLVSAGLGRRS